MSSAPKEDLFNDERIVVTLKAEVASVLGQVEITRFVTGPQSKKILKVLLQGLKVPNKKG